MSVTNKNDEVEYTEEQVKEMNEKMLKYYSAQNILLEQQAKYEILLADIEEARCKRVTMNLRIANLLAESRQKKEPQDDKPKDQQQENIEKLAKKLKTSNSTAV